MSTITELLGGLRRESDRGKISGKLGEIKHSSVDIVADQGVVEWLADSDQLDSVRIQSEQPILLPDAVYSTLDALVTPTAQRQAAERYRIPMPYVRRLVEAGHVDLAASHLNELQRREPKQATLRMLHADDGWALRSIVSDRYGVLDNLDMMQSVMSGLSDADIGLADCEVDADWTTDRFRLRIAVPSIAAYSPELLGDYRPPFSMSPARGIHDAPGGDEPTPPALWAGLEISNSETGNGAMSITPRVVMLVCRNGMTRTVDMLRKVHLGGKLDEGVVQWSSETKSAAMQLVTSQISDAARSFCSVEYLHRTIEKMTAAKHVAASASTSIEVLTKTCSLSDAESALVLDAFAASGDSSVLGLGNAVTLAAQHVDDGDRQSELEAAFWTIVDQPQQFAAVAAR